MLNLDTHILVDFFRGELQENETKILKDHDNWAISDIVLWEISKLVVLKRLEMDLRTPNFRKLLTAIHVIPISLEIAQKSTELDFKSDPADEIIAATSWVHKAPLLTRDKKIRVSKRIKCLG